MTPHHSAPVRVRVLGTLEIVGDDGASIALASPNLRRLLAGLVLNAGTVVSVDRLADIVWGDDPPTNTTGAVQTLVSRLRSRLPQNDTHVPQIVTRAPGYVLDLADQTLDATVFAGLVERAQAAGADAATVAGLLDEALALWRGDAYAEFRDEPFARAEAARLTELRAAALEDRAEAALAQGDTDGAIARLELLTREHPLRERPHAQLMIALYRAGRHADALAVYRRYRSVLDEELGLEPSAELQHVERQILRADPDLGGAGPPVTDVAMPDGGGRAASRPVRSPTLAPAQALVGRDRLVDDVVGALAPGRPLTLVGPGGVGKSSVALAVAAGAAETRADGVCWCELASIDDDDAVVGLVMTTLRATPRPGAGPLEGVIEVLRSQQLLLVLDNAERVLGGIARLVAAIGQDCPDVVVLVTSRERLGVAAERVVAVPPLAVDPPPPDRSASGDRGDAVARRAARRSTGDGAHGRESPAVQLFCKLAAAAHEGFALTEDNRDAVVDICRRLDGLPLALELAAIRMRSMTPRDLAERLSWRFRVLRGGRRTGADRHRTLRAVVDWSYDLLGERARRVFDLVSVFAGGFTLEAAEHVVAAADATIDAADVADAVAALVDASMLGAHTSSGSATYALLETLRSYGRERLGDGDAMARARRAHAAYYTDLAERVAVDLSDVGPQRAAATLDHAIDELRAAHGWATAHDLPLALRLVAALPPYAEHRAHGEAYTWAETTVTAAEDAGVDPALMTAAYGAAALSARFRGDLEAATALAERGLAHCADPHDPAVYTATYALSEVALYEGRLDDVLALADVLEQVAPSGASRLFDVWLRVSRVLAQAYSGRTDAAITAAERILAAGRREGTPASVAWATYALTEALVEHEPERALPVAEEALAYSRAFDDRFLVGVTLVTAASLHARHGNASRAVELFRETIDRWRRARNWTQQWVAVRSIVGLLLRLGANEHAAVLHGIVLSRSTSSPAFGADAQRLAAAAAELSARLGEAGFATARARGVAMSDDQAIAWTRDVLDRLADALPTDDV
ncbi:MAG TPA: BTAD domain-containing putative transcriptional regulator [Euzebyales bacterium]